MSIAIGSLIAVINSLNSERWLGLVVDQEAGKKWVERDPCLEYHLEEKDGPLLVRVLGLKLTEGRALDKSGLPEQEPRGIETVRWAFVQTIPNPPWIAAGPDLSSVEDFLRSYRLCNSFGMTEATFFHEVALLAEYLRGVTRTEDEISCFDRKFFAMLVDVLPR